MRLCQSRHMANATTPGRMMCSRCKCGTSLVFNHKQRIGTGRIISLRLCEFCHNRQRQVEARRKKTEVTWNLTLPFELPFVSPIAKSESTQ